MMKFGGMKEVYPTVHKKTQWAHWAVLERQRENVSTHTQTKGKSRRISASL